MVRAGPTVVGLAEGGGPRARVRCGGAVRGAAAVGEVDVIGRAMAAAEARERRGGGARRGRAEGGPGAAALRVLALPVGHGAEAGRPVLLAVPRPAPPVIPAARGRDRAAARRAQRVHHVPLPRAPVLCARRRAPRAAARRGAEDRPLAAGAAAAPEAERQREAARGAVAGAAAAEEEDPALRRAVGEAVACGTVAHVALAPCDAVSCLDGRGKAGGSVDLVQDLVLEARQRF